jgi:hypothetical protein
MLFTEMLVATNLWWMERKDKGAHHFILRLIPFLFQVIESLYIQTRKLPLSLDRGPTNIEVGGSYVINFNMFLPSDEYTTLRVILSLMGDIYNPVKVLKENDKLMELTPFIQQLYDHANKFRKVRNFFTHLDEVLTDMDKHGITGPAKTNCGIEYASSAKGCVHLVWHQNVLHFTYKKEVCEITIDKSIFDPIFQIAKEIYSEIISHKIYPEQKNYRPVEEFTFHPFGAFSNCIFCSTYLPL